MGTLQNIYFNIKDSGHFDKFVLQKKLVQFADKLVCEPGVGGLLGTQEAVAFLTSKHVSPYYPEHFLLKFQNNFYIKIFLNSQTFFV